MKKIVSAVLVLAMLLSLVALTGCSGAGGKLKFGFGITAGLSDLQDASEDGDGAGTFNTTAVAVLLDKDSKIVKIAMDTMQLKASWTAEGKVNPTSDFRTKYEKGTDYGMAAHGTDLNGDGKVLEWNEQADAFMTAVTGKTLEEAKAYMDGEGYGTGDLATAGCTIHVTDFISALEKAVNNAAESEAKSSDNLNLAMVASPYYSNKDATEEAEGSDRLDTTVVAAVVRDGKVVSAITDAAYTSISFDITGAVTNSPSSEIKSKLEEGDNYGMAAAAVDRDGNGKALEWYEQADGFNKTLVGKTADEISGMVGDDGYGTDDLLAAGCSISVGDMVAAAVKAAK